MPVIVQPPSAIACNRAPRIRAWGRQACLCGGLLILALLVESSNAVAEDGVAAIQCMAQTIYFEARGEPDLGKVAVAHVVLNRSRDAQFPASICEVAYQQGGSPREGCQFSWTCDSLSDRPVDIRAWRRSVALARAVYYGKSVDPTAGATYFHADSVDPAWSRNMEPALRIGHHLFYRSASARQRTVVADGKQARSVDSARQFRPAPPWSLRQVADQINQALALNAAPQLTISVLVYSANKARRRVRINSATYSEGDWLDNDLRLVAIKSGGIIVARGPARFDVSVR